MKIIWSEDANADYHENIEYLLNEWSEKSATTFIEEVDAVLELIKIHPKLYPKADQKSIRRAVIRKQITLFYLEKGSTIYLIRLWNTRKDPESLNL